MCLLETKSSCWTKLHVHSQIISVLWYNVQFVGHLLYNLRPFRRLTQCHKCTVGEDSAHDHHTEQFASSCQGSHLFICCIINTIHAYQINILMKGYECTKILIDILLRRLKGLRRYKAGVALKRKMKFPLFNTMKVWQKKREFVVIVYKNNTVSLQLLIKEYLWFTAHVCWYNHIVYVADESHINLFYWPGLPVLYNSKPLATVDDTTDMITTACSARWENPHSLSNF